MTTSTPKLTLHVKPSPTWLAAAIVTLLHAGAAVLFLADRAPVSDAALLGFPIDDAWIHMVYGRSLAEHGLPYYNPGQLETGFTSPLWILVVAVAHWIGALLSVAPWAVVKLIGVVLGATACVLVFHLAHALTKSFGASLFGAVLAAVSPTAVFAGLSGMEVTLASTTALGVALAYQRGNLRSSGVLLAACAISRPEGLVLVAATVVASTFASARRNRAEKLAAASKLGLPTAAAMGAWMLFCLYATRRPLPNTFYQKAGTASPGSWFGTVGETVMAMPANMGGAGLLLLALAVMALRWRRERPTTVLVLSFPWIFLVAIAATRELPPGHSGYFVWLRYMAPALPFLFVGMASGMALLLELPSWIRARAPAAARPLTLAYIPALSLGALALLPYPDAIDTAKQRFAWNCQNMNEVQVAFGRWVGNHTPERAAVMVNDAGAIRYFSERRNVDLLGLNCADMLDPARAPVFLDPRAMAQLMQMEGARYMVIFPSWFPNLVDHARFMGFFEPVLALRSENYTICKAAGMQDRMWAFRLR